MPTYDRNIAPQVLAEQVRQLYGKGVYALLANLVTSAILVTAEWSVVSHDLAVAWLAVLYLTVVVRLALWFRYRREPASGDHTASTWARRWTVGALVTGAIWGAGGVALFPESHPAGQFLLLFVIGGMVAGVSASGSILLRAFLAFSLPATLPPVILLLLTGNTTHQAAALLLVAFLLGMTVIAKRDRDTFCRSLRLRFKNSLLVDELSAAHEQLLRLNRELESRVAERTQELQHAVSERERFMSVVSHELRTPLQALKLSQEVLLAMLQRPAPDPDPDPEHLGRLVASCAAPIARLQRFADDLLDTTRLSAERMHYEKHSVALDRIVDETLAQMGPQLGKAQAGFTVDVQEGLIGTWDSQRIQQVLTNLIANALTYGAEPYTLQARRIDGDVQIMISDGGAGIASDQLERIFEPFERVAWRSDSVGLGLGLYIAKRIVSAHDGKLSATSAPGQGTIFTIELPLH